MGKNSYHIDEFHKKNESDQKRMLRATLKKLGITSTSRKERRNILKIYSDILNAIQAESQGGTVKPTRIQFLTNMSYDNCVKQLDLLAGLSLIQKTPLSLTDKGKAFLTDFEKICSYLD